MQSFHETHSCISHLPFLETGRGSKPTSFRIVSIHLVGKVALCMPTKLGTTMSRGKFCLFFYLIVFSELEGNQKNGKRFEFL